MADARRPQSTADRNLLFGILALQMDFISREALIQAMHAWVLAKAKPLDSLAGRTFYAVGGTWRALARMTAIRSVSIFGGRRRGGDFFTLLALSCFETAPAAVGSLFLFCPLFG